MYKCSKCSLQKPESDFYFTNLYRRKYCKKCEHKSQVANRLKKKKRAVEYLGGRCIRCGYNECFYALEFDHVDPSTKEYEMSNMIYGRNWALVGVELDKCQLLCANCHRIKTFLEL